VAPCSGGVRYRNTTRHHNVEDRDLNFKHEFSALKRFINIVRSCKQFTDISNTKR
jgi:hypothetical protein